MKSLQPSTLAVERESLTCDFMTVWLGVAQVLVIHPREAQTAQMGQKSAVVLTCKIGSRVETPSLSRPSNLKRTSISVQVCFSTFNKLLFSISFPTILRVQLIYIHSTFYHFWQFSPLHFSLKHTLRVWHGTLNTCPDHNKSVTLAPYTPGTNDKSRLCRDTFIQSLLQTELSALLGRKPCDTSLLRIQPTAVFSSTGNFELIKKWLLQYLH